MNPTRRAFSIQILCCLAATCGLEAASVSEGKSSTAQEPAPVAAPAEQSVFDRMVLDGEYRLRVTRLQTELTQPPGQGTEAIDTSVSHRLRLGMVLPFEEDLLLRARFSTNASRWGDINIPAATFSTREFDFDTLLLIYKHSPETTLLAGRGAARYFEADLVVATGRFDGDNVFYEALLLEHKPDPDTMLILGYSPLFTTNLVDANPVEVSMDAVIFNARHNFTPDDQLLFHFGTLNPRRPLLGLSGTKRLNAISLRYDHTFDEDLKAFVSGAINLTQTDGFAFTALPDLDAGDRSSFFGGVTFGDASRVGDDQFDVYYTKTGKKSQNIVAEFPDDIREVRGQWQRQFRKNTWLLASAVHRENLVRQPVPNVPTFGQSTSPADESTIVYAQIEKKF